MLKDYQVYSIVGDRYSGEWVRQAFRDRGIQYEVAQQTASDSFLELLPLINQGSIELLDDKRQTAQLIALERKRGKSGKDSLSHPPGGHDDRANALAHCAVAAGKPKSHWGFINYGEDAQPEEPDRFHAVGRMRSGRGLWKPRDW